MNTTCLQHKFEERFHIKSNSFWDGLVAFFNLENPFKKAEKKIFITSAQEAMLADIKAMHEHNMEIFAKLELLKQEIEATYLADKGENFDEISKIELDNTEDSLQKIKLILREKYSRKKTDASQ